MQAITKYQASDGAEFGSAAECEAYEAESRVIAGVLSRLPPRPDTCEFANGEGCVWHDRDTFLAVQSELARIAWRHHHGSGIDRHMEYAVDAQRPAGYTLIGRIIDDGGPAPLRRAWYRIMCTDEAYREWGQPYFALNPTKGKMSPRSEGAPVQHIG